MGARQVTHEFAYDWSSPDLIAVADRFTEMGATPFSEAAEVLYRGVQQRGIGHTFLEPGDMTRYELVVTMITPVRYLIQLFVSGKWHTVDWQPWDEWQRVRMVPREIHPWDLPQIENTWTKCVFLEMASQFRKRL